MTLLILVLAVVYLPVFALCFALGVISAAEGGRSLWWAFGRALVWPILFIKAALRC